MWQRQDWFISALIGALILICIVILMPQLTWFFLTLIVATVVLLLIGVAVFFISKKFSEKFLDKEDQNLVNVIFAGTIIIALSQLFGPLFGAFYPLILGPEASDYNLAFSSMYYNVTLNNSTYMYDITSRDIPVQHYPYNPFKNSEQISFHTKISAVDLNPIMGYDEEIFLDLIPPNKVNASVENPVIKVDQSSDVIISLNPNPGTYPIKVQGEGADGKVRKAMTVIGVPSKIGTRLFTPNRPHIDESEFDYDQLSKQEIDSIKIQETTKPTNPSDILNIDTGRAQGV